jgi:hypothetical protein
MGSGSAFTPTEVAELQERVARLERQMASMADVVGELIKDVIGEKWDYESLGRMTWEEFRTREEWPDDPEIAGDPEFVGWWVYQGGDSHA